MFFFSFALEKCMTRYISIKNAPFQYFNQVSKRKYSKLVYFAFISLKRNSPFNLTLKDMHKISYFQNLNFRKNVLLMFFGF